MTGFICLDKPEGITSFTAVNKVRRIFSLKKAGHTGTLDPMATGVLPIMLGGATKFADFMPSGTKAYEADILLGLETDSYDVTGNVLSQKEVTVTRDEFEKTVELFVGEIEQYPPMYSAVSQNGVRLYKLARQGIEVEREKRKITVYSAQVTASPEENVYTVTFSCSAGTYIRSLAHDIGEKLGCGACLKRLRRTYSNGFSLAESVTLEQLAALSEEGKLSQCVKKVDDVFSVYPKVFVSEAQSKRFHNGGALDINRIKNIKENGLYRVYSPESTFLGLGKTNAETNELEIARLLISED